MTLRVTQLKPNPSGRDRTTSGATATQLAGEWVDLHNEGIAAFDLRELHLFHRAYKPYSTTWEWAKVMAAEASFQALLLPGQTLRIHSGRVRDLSVIAAADRFGADVHGFTGHDSFIWNNENADEAGVWEPARKAFRDRAEYSAHPPEGVVLVRVGDMLVQGSPLGRSHGLTSTRSLR